VLIRGGSVKIARWPYHLIRGTLDTSGVKDRRQAAPVRHQAPKSADRARPVSSFLLAFPSCRVIVPPQC